MIQQKNKIEIWKKDLPKEVYELLDCGNGEKLEKIGEEIIIRPEPRAWWQKTLDKESWNKADAIYKLFEQKGKWIFKNGQNKKEFDVEIDGIRLRIKFGGSSKHIGFFPEQYSEWLWLSNKIKNEISNNNKKLNILNLFGYTGLSSLFAARNGAMITHVDASETSIEWARENQKISDLKNLPIRWILDDTLKFIKREVKRGIKYDAIIMDPPSFGRGPKGEIWKIEENIKELLDLCRELLTENPLFVMINMYSTELSSISLQNLLQDMINQKSGKIITGELTIKQKNFDRILPLSIFSIWEN